jgi:hypothetical protein
MSFCIVYYGVRTNGLQAFSTLRQWSFSRENTKSHHFQLGAPGRAMLGLWDRGTMPIIVSQRVAFEFSLTDLHKGPERLKRACIKARNFAGQLTKEPVLLAWMPPAAVYFRSPDSTC